MEQGQSVLVITEGDDDQITLIIMEGDQYWPRIFPTSNNQIWSLHAMLVISMNDRERVAAGLQSDLHQITIWPEHLSIVFSGREARK